MFSQPPAPLLLTLVVLAFVRLGLAAPANDNLSDYEELPPSGPATVGSNVGATLEVDEPIPAGITASNYGATVWWGLQLAASEGKWYDVSTEGSAIDTVLAVWTGGEDDIPLTLVHVNDEAVEGGFSRVRFLAAPEVIYKVSVAGRGAAQQGSIAVRASSTVDPFAKVSEASFSPSGINVTNAEVPVTATLTLTSTKEIASGQFTLYSPSGIPLQTLPFSGANNRTSGNVAEGTYEVHFTLPQGSEPGDYRWNLSMVSVGPFPSSSSYGWEALSPLPSGATKTIPVINTTPINTYAVWASAISLSGPESDPEDDFDNDGIKNLTEFALGLDPQVSSRAQLIADASSITQLGLPRITRVGTGIQQRLRVEYARRIGDSSLSYIVQFSNDLITWNNATQSASVLSSNGTMQAVAVEDVTSNPVKMRRFARVRIVR